MIKKLKRILLIDDSSADNFIHQRYIEKANVTESIVIKQNGEEALEYLKTVLTDNQFPQPELIFLDINMPVMDGWEFLEKYQELMAEQKARIILTMLTTSTASRDRERARQYPHLTEFIEKPLTDKILLAIVRQYFPDHFEQEGQEEE